MPSAEKAARFKRRRLKESLRAGHALILNRDGGSCRRICRERTYADF